MSFPRSCFREDSSLDRRDPIPATAAGFRTSFFPTFFFPPCAPLVAPALLPALERVITLVSSCVPPCCVPAAAAVVEEGGGGDSAPVSEEAVAGEDAAVAGDDWDDDASPVPFAARVARSCDNSFRSRRPIWMGEWV